MQKANSKRDLHSKITFQKCISSTCRIIKKPVLDAALPCIEHGVHPYITSAKKLDGWGQTMALLADVQYCIYAEIVGSRNSGWVRKSSKIC